MITIRQNYNWKFEGEFPDVPFAEGVNEEELLQIDPDPLFVTLPIAQDGLTATDGLAYRPAFNDRLIETIVQKKIGGNMGHPSLWFNNSRSETTPIQWVGATRDDKGVIWAKGFIKNEEVKKHFKTKKAIGAKVSTSIMGFAEPGAIVYHENGTYDVDPSKFHLRFIDIIDDPDDAALQFEREFNLTKHSKSYDNDREDTDNMTITSVDQVPVEIRRQIEQQFAARQEQTNEVAELQQTLSAVREELAQTKAKNAELAKTIFHSKLTDLIKNSIGLEGIDRADEDMLVTFVRNSVRAEIGSSIDVEAAKAAIEAVLQSDVYKRLAQTVVTKATGGRAFSPAYDATESKSAGEIAEENIDSILSEWGRG